jgi:hypothetical protein
MNCPVCAWDMSAWKNTTSGAEFWECGMCLRAGKATRVPIGETAPSTPNHLRALLLAARDRGPVGRGCGSGRGAAQEGVPGPVCDRDSVLHEREPGGDLYFGGIKVTSGPMVSSRDRKLSKEGQETYDRLRDEYGLVRPDGFTQSAVDAAKAVLLSKGGRR